MEGEEAVGLDMFITSFRTSAQKACLKRWNSCWKSKLRRCEVIAAVNKLPFSPGRTQTQYGGHVHKS